MLKKKTCQAVCLFLVLISTLVYAFSLDYDSFTLNILVNRVKNKIKPRIKSLQSFQIVQTQYFQLKFENELKCEISVPNVAQTN